MKKILSLLLTLMMLFSVVPTSVLAENDVATATVYLTVSNKGVIASANDGSIMANREVSVKDIDEDGKLTYDEALVAAHKAYNSESGYSAPGGYVSKLWGMNTTNASFFINNQSFSSSVGATNIKDGDYLVASINKDNLYYADWYSYFDATEKSVKVNEEFTLTLKGHLGMAFSDEDKIDTVLPSISIGTVSNGEFSAIDNKTTNSDGEVTISFDKAGKYYVSASGTVKDLVSDWSQPPYDGSVTMEADCPIIAPVCVVTVEDEKAPSTDEAEDAIGVYLTVSNKGVIASANDGSIMANREVSVTDANGDGKLTFDDALISAHKTYNSEDGYGSSSGSGMSANKLWGVETQNTLYFINDTGLTDGVNVDIIEDGDYLVASINADKSGSYADWYSFFDITEKEVKANEEFALNLKGFYGMAYMPEDLTPAPLNGISIGIWNNGVFSAIPEKTTDANGNVSLSFENEGTYYITASGTVRDTLMNWNEYKEVEMDCPIIAPVCKITVVQGEETDEPEKPLMSDEEAADIIYTEFSDKDKNYSNTTKTPLVFPLEYNGETYTNVVEYLEAWAYTETGKEVIVNYTPYIYTTKYKDWSTGELKELSYDGMDINTEIYSDYFTNNAQKNMNRLDSVSFTVGSTTTDTIDKLCIGVASKIRTPDEIVNYIANQLPFERIINTNVSKDEVITALGEKSGSSVALPNTTGLYNTTAATITWSANNISGATDAFSVKSNKTTILRPNVGEENAVFDLTATIQSKTDTSVSKSVTHRITVPSFEGVVVPIEVTEGATLTLTDKYYKKQVDSKYIVKAETATEGYDLYYCTLHKSATGTAQKFDYEVSKDGYITTTDTISVENDNPEKIVITLSASTEDDAKLASLSLKKPVSDSHDIISGISFDKDTYEYNIKVSGIRTIEFNAAAITEGATVKITSYYKSTNDANSGKLTTGTKAISTKCYLPDSADTISTVEITVTAPESSTQEIKTRTYKINIEKVASSGPLTALTITPVSSTGGKKDSWAGDDGLSAVEGELSPSFVTGTRALGTYTVNYWFDKVKVMLTTISGTTNLVGEEGVASGKQSSEIPLVVGENKIPLSITDADGNVTKYTLTVYRKSQLEIVSAEVENGAINKQFESNGAERSNNGRFSAETETLRMKFNTNIENNEGVDIRVKLDETVYWGKAGEFIEIPVKDKDSAMLFVYLYKKVNGVNECQAYIINMSRMPATSPNSVASYLPAPGQFVNLDNAWGNPEQTLTGKAGITLGAFGGNVVYKYDTPIKNDAKNPYGIDFIITGNCFTDSDGGTSASAAEPASVMVSKDGENWYELAGSEYYTADVRRNITVTYENTDTSFEKAVEVPWIDSEGEYGFMPVVESHPQSYFPNTERYGKYQTGIGKNNSYTEKSVSFSGTMIGHGFYPFGYADSHSSNPEMLNAAVNPYGDNHRMNYNGDGFDLAWAVDQNGDPVDLDEISYIKVYNPILSYGSSRGELSPEIQSVSRTFASENEVGKSDGLTGLFVNGEEIALSNNSYTYTIDGKGASSLKIKPICENTDANIYVSNQRVASGTESSAISVVSKLRVIVQEDEKEPVIYILNFTNVPTKEDNADLTSLILTPGDIENTPTDENSVSFEIANSISAVRFAPEFAYSKATALLTGESLAEPIELSHNTQSKSVNINVGENTFKLAVTSENHNNTKEYIVTVTRKSAGSSVSDDTISVKFMLIGDTKHSDGGKHTPSTWISQKTVKIPKNSTVKYLTEMILNNEGIDYKTDGIYISEIDGLAEFDNGPNSGWMFRLNGNIANEGYATRTLSSGDVIKWFYTDDYTKESGYENWKPTGGSPSGNNNKDNKEETKTEDTDKETEALEKPAFTETTFADVKKDDWHYESVKYVYENNLMQGTDNGFEPESRMSRAMLVTVLYRMAKPEEKANNHNFADVPEGQWYSDAVAWAASNGIVSGISKTEFAPDSDISREQMALIIYRFAKMQGYDVTNKADISSFADTDDVSDWAIDALSWANKAGLVNGTNETTLSPKATATRAQVAAILMRFCENIAK